VPIKAGRATAQNIFAHKLLKREADRIRQGDKSVVSQPYYLSLSFSPLLSRLVALVKSSALSTPQNKG
jgi:hypothetical protein